MFQINKILVPLDLQDKAGCARLIEASFDLAQKYDAKLHFLNVLDVDLESPMIDRFDDIKDEYLRTARSRLKKLISEKAPAGHTADIHVAPGRSYAMIIEAAEDIKADLIIISAHKPAMKDYLLGSTAARVVRHGTCSVLVLRD